MSKKKQINYYIPKEDILSTKNSNIIKWYEYKIKSLEENDANGSSLNEDSNNSNESIDESQDVIFDDSDVEMYGPDEEEIDLANSGLSDDEQSLVADILARFSEAKSVQNNIDNVVNQYGQQDNTNPDDLIASICAPKQNNVDDLVKQARGE